VIDLKRLRQDPDGSRASLLRRRDPSVGPLLDAILELDRQRRELLVRSESLKAERNAATEEVARRKRAKEPADENGGEKPQPTGNQRPGKRPKSAACQAIANRRRFDALLKPQENVRTPAIKNLLQSAVLPEVVPGYPAIRRRALSSLEATLPSMPSSPISTRSPPIRSLSSTTCRCTVAA